MIFEISLRKGYFVNYSADSSTLSILIVTDCKHFDPPPVFRGYFFSSFLKARPLQHEPQNFGGCPSPPFRGSQRGSFRLKARPLQQGCFFTSPVCFEGFACCDASLRNEGCFFSGDGLPKLASEQGGDGKKQRAPPLHHGKSLTGFCQHSVCHPALVIYCGYHCHHPCVIVIGRRIDEVKNSNHHSGNAAILPSFVPVRENNRQ